MVAVIGRALPQSSRARKLADADIGLPSPCHATGPVTTSVNIAACTDSCHCVPMTDDILLTNMDSVPGRTIVRHIGLAQGNVVRAKHVGRDIAAGLKNIVGGELRGYTELLEEARRDAIRRMTEDARQQGANAVVNIRLSTSSVTSGASELYAYGTAVVIE